MRFELPGLINSSRKFESLKTSHKVEKKLNFLQPSKFTCACFVYNETFSIQVLQRDE